MKGEREKYNRIKSILALKEVKSIELAQHLSVTPQTVSKWCTNYSQPSIPELFRIAKFLDVGIIDLLEPVK